LLLASIPVFVFCPSYGEEAVILNKTSSGREIKVRIGATIQVELEQLGAAGYAWEIQELDKEHFSILGVKTEERPSGADLVGAPIMKTWRIRAIKAGKSKLKLIYYRPWEAEKNAIDTFVLNVRILGAK